MAYDKDAGSVTHTEQNKSVFSMRMLVIEKLKRELVIEN